MIECLVECSGKTRVHEGLTAYILSPDQEETYGYDLQPANIFLRYR